MDKSGTLFQLCQGGRVSESGRHPDVAFTADGIWPRGQGAAITGALAIRGQTRPLSFDAAASVPRCGYPTSPCDPRVNPNGDGHDLSPEAGVATRHMIAA